MAVPKLAPSPALYIPKCDRCADNGDIEGPHGYRVRCSCTSSDEDRDAWDRAEYEIDRLEERASTVFAGAREDFEVRR